MPKRGFSFEIFDLRLDEKEKNIVSVVMQSKDRLKRIFRISHKTQIRNEFFLLYSNKDTVFFFINFRSILLIRKFR